MGIFSFFSKEKKETLDKGLSKTKENVFSKLTSVFRKNSPATCLLQLNRFFLYSLRNRMFCRPPVHHPYSREPMTDAVCR